MKTTSIDRGIIEFDRFLRTSFGKTHHARRPSPAKQQSEAILTAEEKILAGRLMRVNHCGEVCAQALYNGQALTASSSETTKSMQQASQEETDHLVWCEQRLDELDTPVSKLNPFWYASSYLMGALTGLMGDRINLGFVAATEAQVCKHLDDHLERLPANDEKSRAILSQMKTDEKKHESEAIRQGGTQFPSIVRKGMTQVSKIMTRSTYWI